jgi:hypothetical protein
MSNVIYIADRKAKQTEKFVKEWEERVIEAVKYIREQNIQCRRKLIVIVKPPGAA